VPLPGIVTPFDAAAKRYDAWFDSPAGRAIFRAELDCLQPLTARAPHPWLEIGVGTGRFALALGVDAGIDPSRPMLALASARGLSVTEGVGEALPYAAGIFGGVLMVTTICFLAQPEKVFAEAIRVLRPGGYLVVGLIPADSPWGEEYARRGREGHPVYSRAHFHTAGEVISTAEAAGLQFKAARSCLLAPPGTPLEDERARPGILPIAGFVAMAFQRSDGPAAVEEERTRRKGQR
jgi:SAM-dependent methyltransferase